MNHTISRRMKKCCYFLILFLLSGISCIKKVPQEPEVKILARVGDKTISVDEFIKRAELSIRPQNFKDKKVVLNNLVAEKLFALEIGKNNDLVKNEKFQAYIKGIQEQQMREQLYYNETINKINLDTTEIKKNYRLAGREYNVEFFTIHNDELAEKIEKIVLSEPDSFETIYYEVTGNTKIPEHKIAWKDPDHDVIHDALFSEPLMPNKLIGPLKLEEDNYIIIKVKNWVNRPAIGTEDVHLRWEEVKEKLKQKKSRKTWRKYKREIMQGKKVEFEKETFLQLADLSFSLYLQNENDTINQKLWKIKDKELTLNILDDDALLDKPFFTIDNKMWTVRDFRKEIMSHPLVFRKKILLDKRDYNKQFKLAIVDMLVDHYLTREAYKKSLHRDRTVKRKVVLWQDALLSRYHRDEYLKAIVDSEDFNEEYMKGSETYISIYIDSLLKKYDDNIEINLEEFEKIELTKINLFVLQHNVPYPVVVPSFPRYTVKSTISYGHEIKNN